MLAPGATSPWFIKDGQVDATAAAADHQPGRPVAG